MTEAELLAQLPALRRYARALTGDTWLADDLVQDTLERACSRWRLWTAGSDLRAWLFTILHNLHASHLRDTRRRAQLAPQVPLEDVEDRLRSPAADPGFAIDLQRCLLRLPEEQRATLLLVVLEDLTHAEVARITGVPVGTVMSRLARARARLDTLLQGEASTSADARPVARVLPLKRAE